jgi:two-component system nitrogen regulation response regulator GlnG
VDRVTPEALELLQRYPWPGNVRELQSVLKQAILQATGPVLVANCFPQAVLARAGNVRELQGVLKKALVRAHGPVPLPDFLPELREMRGGPAAPVTPPGGGFDLEAFIRQRLGPDARDLYKATLRELHRLLLPRVLEYTGGSQHRAAILLGIARQTLRAKLRDLGLPVAHSAEANEDDRRRPAGGRPRHRHVTA